MMSELLPRRRNSRRKRGRKGRKSRGTGSRDLHKAIRAGPKAIPSKLGLPVEMLRTPNCGLSWRLGCVLIHGSPDPVEIQLPWTVANGCNSLDIKGRIGVGMASGYATSG